MNQEKTFLSEAILRFKRRLNDNPVKLNLSISIINLLIIISLILIIDSFHFKDYQKKDVSNTSRSTIVAASPSRAFGKRNNSPLYINASGSPYLRTWTVIFDGSDTVLRKAFPAYDSNKNYWREVARQQSAQTFDVVMSSSEFMNKSRYNNGGQAIDPNGHLHYVQEGSAWWNYFVSFASNPSNGISFGDMFAPPCGSNCQGTRVPDYSKDKVRQATVEFWSSDSLVNSLKNQGYDGKYWDSGVVMNGFNELLGSLKSAMNAKGLKILNNTGVGTWVDNVNRYAANLNGNVEEHFFFNGWESTYYGAALALQQVRMAWYKANTPQLMILAQGGDYDDCKYFNDWSSQGTYALAQRVHMASLASYLALYDPSLNYYYRYSGICNTVKYTNEAAWLHDERGEIPFAVAYNLGLPTASFSYHPARTNYNALELNGTVKSYQSETVYRPFENGEIYLRPPQPYGWKSYENAGRLAQACSYFHEQSRTNPINLNGSRFLVGYDGSLIGPIDAIRLMQAEGAVLLKSPFKMNSFLPARFDDSITTSRYQSATAKEGSLIYFDPLTAADFFNEALKIRPAQVVLKTANEGAIQTKVTFLRKLNLNPAAGASYDLDSHSSFGERQAGFRTDILSEFNVPARIEFAGSQMERITQPEIYKDTKRCEASGECKIIEFIPRQKIVIEVGGFSIYTVNQKGDPPPSNLSYGNSKKTAKKGSADNTTQPEGATNPAQSSSVIAEESAAIPVVASSKTWRKYSWILIVCLLLAAGATYWWWRRHKHKITNFKNYQPAFDGNNRLLTPIHTNRFPRSRL